ncbi:alpha-amylase [Arthrobacter citreus]|nr:alpha-amylase [Arthrobacter citreus]
MRRFGFIILVSVLFLSTLPSISFAEKNTTDLKKEMIYRILIDRFFDGNPRNNKNTDPKDLTKSQGGDLEGITQKLDYLKDFGYTAISISPIFKSDENSYDGYSVVDFKKMDPRFGTIEDLKKLVKEAHKRKIKIFIDFVANNVSPNSELAKNANWFNPENSTSSEKKWINGLPDFNQENADVANYLIDAGKYWMDQASFDGYNLQEVNNVPVSFWKTFNQELKKKNPNFILLADLNESSEMNYSKYDNLDFNGIYNVDLVGDLANTFSSQNQSLTEIMKQQKDLTKQLGSTLMINYVDDEMTKRFVSIALSKGQYPPSRLKLALTYLFTSPGIPLTYYGTEIALNGGNIPDNRKGMDFRTDQDFSDYIKKLTELRRTLPSLTNGNFEVLYDSKGMTLFKRHDKDETTIIAINNTSLDQKVHLNFDVVKKSDELRGLLADDLVRPNKKGFDIVLKRESSNVYAVAPKTGLNIGIIIAIPSIFVAFIIFLWLARRRNKQ